MLILDARACFKDHVKTATQFCKDGYRIVEGIGVALITQYTHVRKNSNTQGS